jgi:hypothetical protein
VPTVAFPHNHASPMRARELEIDGKKVPYGNQIAWAGIATSNGLPATTMPIAHTGGLPIGVQIIGGYLDDIQRLPSLTSSSASSAASPRPRAFEQGHQLTRSRAESPLGAWSTASVRLSTQARRDAASRSARHALQLPAWLEGALNDQIPELWR